MKKIMVLICSFCFLSACTKDSDSDEVIVISGDYNVNVHYSYREFPQSMYDTPNVHIDSFFQDVMTIQQSNDSLLVSFEKSNGGARLLKAKLSNDTLYFSQQYPISPLGETYLKYNIQNGALAYSSIQGPWHGPETLTEATK